MKLAEIFLIHDSVSCIRFEGIQVRIGLIVVAILAVAGAFAWFIDRGGIFPTKEIRYRFEVTVETPDGLMTAHSVHRLVIQDQTMTPARNYQTDLDGEAAMFELPDGSYLFATLRFDGGMGPVQLFGTTLGRSGYSFARWIDAATQFDAQVPEGHLPKLAHLDASKEPGTLRMLEDTGSLRVVSARLVSTNEEVTASVATALPWLVPTIIDRPKPPTPIPEINVLSSYLKVGVL